MGQPKCDSLGQYIGEEITSDYLNGIPFMSTHERRIKLLQQKLFLCKCQACKAPCALRAFACPKLLPTSELPCGGRCQSRVAQLGEDEAHGGDMAGAKEWICQTCGDVTSEQLLFSRLFRLYKQLDGNEIEVAGKERAIQNGAGTCDGTRTLEAQESASTAGEAGAWLQVEEMWVARSYSNMYWSHDDVRSPLSEMCF